MIEAKRQNFGAKGIEIYLCDGMVNIEGHFAGREPIIVRLRLIQIKTIIQSIHRDRTYSARSNGIQIVPFLDFGISGEADVFFLDENGFNTMERLIMVSASGLLKSLGRYY